MVTQDTYHILSVQSDFRVIEQKHQHVNMAITGGLHNRYHATLKVGTFNVHVSNDQTTRTSSGTKLSRLRYLMIQARVGVRQKHAQNFNRVSDRAGQLKTCEVRLSQ